MNPSVMEPIVSQPSPPKMMSRSRLGAMVLAHWMIVGNFLLLFVAAFLYTELMRLLNILTPFDIAKPFPVAALPLQDFGSALWNAYYNYFRYQFFGFYIALLTYAILRWRPHWFHRGNATLLGIGVGFTFLPLFMWFIQRAETQIQLATAPYVFAPYLLGTIDVPGLDLWFPWATVAVFACSCGMVGRYLYSFWATTSQPIRKRWDDWLWEIGAALLLMGIFSTFFPVHTSQLNQPIAAEGMVTNISSISLHPHAQADRQWAIVELQLVNQRAEAKSLFGDIPIMPQALDLMDQHGASFNGKFFTFFPEPLDEPYARDGLPFFLNGNGERMQMWLRYDLPRTSVPMALYLDSRDSKNKEVHLIKLIPAAAGAPSLPTPPTIGISALGAAPLSFEILEQVSGTELQTMEMERNRFVAIKVRFPDKMTNPQLTLGGNFQLIDTNGFVYSESLMMSNLPISDTVLTNFRETGEGWLEFVIPQNATLNRLRFYGTYNEQDIEIVVPFTEH